MPRDTRMKSSSPCRRRAVRRSAARASNSPAAREALLHPPANVGGATRCPPEQAADRRTPPSARAPFGVRERQIGNKNEPQRLGGEHEDEIDAVRAEEPVGLRRPAELLREQCARTGCGKRQDDLREAGQQPAAKGARSPAGASL